MLETVLRLAQNNVGYGKSLLKDLPDEQLCLVPSAGMNHPAWIIGHVSWACDTIVVLLGGQAQTDDQWRSLFSNGTQAVAERERYPSKQVLLDTLLATSGAAIEALRQAPGDVLARELPWPELRRIMPTVGVAAANILTNHTALHLGQLSAWRRLHGYTGVMRI